MSRETWIRVVTYVSDDPDAADKYSTQTAQSAVRILEQIDGCTLGYWGQDPDTGEMAAVTYWVSKDAIDAAQPKLTELHDERAKLGIRVSSAKNFLLRRVSPFTS